MIIKHTELDDSKLVRLCNRLLAIRYFKLFAFIGIVVAVSLFLVSAKQTYKLSTYVLYVRGVISNNVNIIPNYYSGLFSNPDIVHIDMKAINYQKLAFLRNQAITNGPTIREEFKEESVKGKITYEGESYKASFSLTGQNMDHISDPSKWSYRVKLKGDGRVAGLKKFTLLVPHTRGSDQLSEFLGHKLMKYVGLISLRYDYKKVIFNGKDHGVYAFEEHLDKRTLENNMLREGLIIKATPGSFKVFKRDDMLANEIFAKQLQYLENNWQSFLIGEIPSSRLFDIKKMAKYYALSDIINGQHTHYLGNEIFHFNPMTMLLEPIGREWDAPYASLEDFDIFLRNISIVGGDLDSENFQKLIFRDQAFVSLYLDALDQYTRKDFIDKFYKDSKAQIDRSKAILYSEYPYLDANEALLFEKIDYIRNALVTPKGDFIHVSKAINSNNKLIISIENASSIPGVVETIVLDSFAHEVGIVIPAKTTKFIQFDAPTSISTKASVKIRLAGQRNLVTKVAKWAELAVLKEDVITIKARDLVIDKSLWVISSDILIKENQQLIVSRGTTIDMINGAGITSYGNVMFEGSAEEPITIKSSDGTGVGIAVFSAKERSLISHTNFSGLSTSKSKIRVLTSPVFFYESNVDFVNCIFDSNISEDGLNIFRSNFSIKNSVFVNSLSDAFDSDFSTGEIVNTSFKNSGNDAIDLSGSNVQLSDVNIDGASDKAISLGEKSVSNGSGIVINNANLGISSKDSSSFSYNNVSISNSEVAFSLYKKKSEFGSSIGEISKGKLLDNGKNFIIEKDSTIKFNARVIRGEYENVKELMYGNIYGTATSK
jgi:hypothetical protein